MAAGDSPTGISNLALAMLSEDPIASLSPPDDNKRGRLCAQFYDTSRREILQASPWREAKRQAQLAAAASAPLFTYAYAFPLPSDYLRPYELPEDGHMRWEIMNLAGIGLCIATDAGPTLDLSYIFDLTDATLMPSLMVKAIAADMAASMAWPLARDRDLAQYCVALREGYLATARTVSAQGATPRRLDVDAMLRSRW